LFHEDSLQEIDKQTKERKQSKTKTDSKGGKRKVEKWVYGKIVQRSINFAID
jgi:hypothetical protein